MQTMNLKLIPPMTRRPVEPMTRLVKSLSVLLLGSIMGLGLCTLAASAWQPAPVLHSNTPVGYEVLLVEPSGAVVSLLGLIECPELEGAQAVSQGVNARIVNAEGKTLTHFPRNFSFRITASLRKTVLVEPTDKFTSSDLPADLLLKLRFRLKVYRGLETHEIQPASIQMIGVPADVPYDERVYRISFSVDKLPVTDRCVLEVLSPSGQLLTKFHFDLL